MVDIFSSNIYIYGDDSLLEIIYLLFDGIHYDALISLDISNDKENEMKIFSVENSYVYDSCKKFALILNEQKQFVNSTSMKLICLQCNQQLTGEIDAQNHAKLTGHENFDQI